MAFDISSVLKNVSGSDTSGREQIEYLPLDRIDPDPNNFYSLDGLDELAGNIELIGLQQPLRVRQGSDGRYTIVSGHRRKAAIMLIQDGGSHQFDDGVPCIVERGEESEAMRELRLIYANASTRVMGPAEIAKQAERVEMLLYRMKEEEGAEFPGRMRDYVAECCRISKTKLARLKAIRKHLAPDLLKIFDRGQINEAVAYALSQQEEDTQRWIVDNYRAGHPNDYAISEDRVRLFAQDVKAVKTMRCKRDIGGGECIHMREHVELCWASWGRAYSSCISADVPRCCINCPSLVNCSKNCPRAEEMKNALKAEAAAEKEAVNAKAKEAERRREEAEKVRQSEAAKYWKRLGEALDAVGLTYRELQDKLINEFVLNVPSWDPNILHNCLDDEAVEKLLAGEPAVNDYTEIPHPFHWDDGVEGAKLFARMADLLDVSIDYLMLRTDEKKNVSGSDTPTLRTGTPPERGLYETRTGVGMEDTPKTASWSRLEWNGSAWTFPMTGRPLDPAMKVFSWFKMPEV